MVGAAVGGAAVGAVVGAAVGGTAVGAVVGAAVGGAAVGAVVGAAVGAVVGTVVGPAEEHSYTSFFPLDFWGLQHKLPEGMGGKQQSYRLEPHCASSHARTQ